MPDYLEYEVDGKIINKHISVDPMEVEGLTVKEVDRETVNSIDISLKKIVNGEIIDKSQSELDYEKSLRALEKIKKESEKQMVIDDLKKIGLKDETINYILNPPG